MFTRFLRPAKLTLNYQLCRQDKRGDAEGQTKITQIGIGDGDLLRCSHNLYFEDINVHKNSYVPKLWQRIVSV